MFIENKTTFKIFVVICIYLYTKWHMKKTTDIKHEQVTMFGSTNCKWTLKLIETLNKNGVYKFSFVDINTPNGELEFSKHGSPGVPFLVNNNTNISILGYKEFSKIKHLFDNR